MAKSTDEQKSRKMKYEDFDLVKFKVQDKGGDVAYYDNSNGKLGKQTAEIKETIHEDLKNAIDALKPIMAQRVGLLSVTDHLVHNFKKSKTVLEYAIEEEKKQIDRCKISGIVVSGENQLKRVQITGSISCPGYGSYGMAAPGINLASEELGYEDKAIQLFENVRKEVYNHVFNGKRAPKPEDNQVDLEDAIADAQGGDKKKQSED